MNRILKILICFGVLGHLYLIVMLPVWHDEFYSIWASTHSVHDIVYSITDPVHPPGYYLLLHFWGLISSHLYWYRVLTFGAFLANILLIDKIAVVFTKPKNRLLLVFLYVFSGYFVIFDWQVRMYTFCNTLTFVSLLFFQKYSEKLNGIGLKEWLFLTAVNFMGLYFDFSFVWYFLPSSILIFLYLLYRENYKLGLVFFSSVLVSVVLFLVASPNLIGFSARGLGGIEWMRRYTTLDFFVPYFLGSSPSKIFSVIFLLFFAVGVTVFLKEKKHNLVMLIVFFSSAVSFCFSLIYSMFFKQLFHVRSMQIVGLSFIFFYYYYFLGLSQRLKKALLAVSVFVFCVNFLLVGNTLSKKSDQLLIEFFPWRNLLANVDLSNFQFVMYQEIAPLPTPLLVYGLQYTLAGNESTGKRGMNLVSYNEMLAQTNCVAFYKGILVLYACR